MLTTFPLLLFLVLLVSGSAAAQEISPLLEFPEAGLDDPAAYRDYTTRFFQDTAGNTWQISLNRSSGRVVNLAADAANESISFSAIREDGTRAELAWGSPKARVHSSPQGRHLEYSLTSSPSLLLGLCLLDSMRKERDYQHCRFHLADLKSRGAWDAGPGRPWEFQAKRERDFIDHINRLLNADRLRHLSLLGAKTARDIIDRLAPTVTVREEAPRCSALIEQTSLDGKNHLSLELSVDSSRATLRRWTGESARGILVQSLDGGPLELRVKLGTDSPALSPLKREQIFQPGFLRFCEDLREECGDALRRFEEAEEGAERVRREGELRAASRKLRWLDRHMRGLELLSSQEKLMAGLPNFATYFGRDTLMTALMMEPIWTTEMLEHVVSGVLGKLSPQGEVSHEESLGGQAIRENVEKYNRWMEKFWEARKVRNQEATAFALQEAEKVLGNLQAVNEDYRMLDDDFQLPVLASRYLKRDIPLERRREFLLSGMSEGAAPRIALLLRNFAYVARSTRPYAENPAPENLIAFPKAGEHRWFPGSWRDSGAGYGNGRFAMDINAIWVPQALRSLAEILEAFDEMGLSAEDLLALAPEMRETPLARYAGDRASLRRAVEIWRGAGKHFEVVFDAQEAEKRIRARLEWASTLGDPEQTAAASHWAKILESEKTPAEISFLAVALDAQGRPIPIANTDIGAWLFLEDVTAQIAEGRADPEEALRRIRILTQPYPAGLMVKGLGPLVANDAYASPDVWESYLRDPYHSPAVVWGREVNLILLGLHRQIASAFDREGNLVAPRLAPYVEELRRALATVQAAVASSGLQHNELWTYRMQGDEPSPARYSTSCDIQLWNVTGLAVQYLLEK